MRNNFLDEVSKGNVKVKRCFNCIKTCDPKNTPYCITEALIEAAKGNVDEGLVFVGANAYRVDKIVPVKELMEELVSAAEAAL